MFIGSAADVGEISAFGEAKPVEQTDAKFLLEHLNVVRDARLRITQLIGGTVEVFRRSQNDEGFQMYQVEPRSPAGDAKPLRSTRIPIATKKIGTVARLSYCWTSTLEPSARWIS